MGKLMLTNLTTVFLPFTLCGTLDGFLLHVLCFFTYKAQSNVGRLLLFAEPCLNVQLHDIIKGVYKNAMFNRYQGHTEWVRRGKAKDVKVKVKGTRQSESHTPQSESQTSLVLIYSVVFSAG